MKTKRISLIAKGKNILSNMVGIKERKIKRAVDAALDKAKEEAISAEESILQIIEKMGDSDSSEHLNSCINQYLDKKTDIDNWTKRVTWIEELQTMLEEEVEVPKEEK